MSTLELAPTVLIIEPDATTERLYYRELSRRFRVLTCSNATAGAELIASESPSVVVLEPFGAGTSLEAIAEVLQEAVRRRDLPVIVCSVLDDRSVGKALGAVMQFVKPVLPSTLLTALTALFPTNCAGTQDPPD